MWEDSEHRNNKYADKSLIYDWSLNDHPKLQWLEQVLYDP